MAFVLDASVTACWAFGDEDHPDAALAFDRIRSEDAVVPALWWFEIRNILVVNERRQRIAEADSRSPVETDVLSLARLHRLSVYEAAYLELALREKLQLATLDAHLQSAAIAEGIARFTRGAADRDTA